MTDLCPIFKWTGGKRREIKHFSPLYPDFVKDGSRYTYVEPFVGAGAVYWHLNNTAGHNVINDYDADVINFYKAVATADREALDYIKSVSSMFSLKGIDNHAERQASYYEWRDLDKDGGLEHCSDAVRAARFYIVNQLAFSGLRRFNAKGEFNASFGHYKHFNSELLEDARYAALLGKTEITQGDYKAVIDGHDEKNTFIFLDPPYTRVMKTYSADNEFGDAKQLELRNTLADLKQAKWMVVIDKADLTMDLYKDYIKHSYPLRYGVNIKNRIDTAVEHLVATNY